MSHACPGEEGTGWWSSPSQRRLDAPKVDPWPAGQMICQWAEVPETCGGWSTKIYFHIKDGSYDVANCGATTYSNYQANANATCSGTSATKGCDGGNSGECKWTFQIQGCRKSWAWCLVVKS